MAAIQIDNLTKLDDFSIITAIGISDGYAKRYPAAREAVYLTTKRNDSWESPLMADTWATPLLRRTHGDFAEDASNYTTTWAVSAWAMTPGDLGRLGKEAFMLRGFVDQPILKKIPLYQKFADSVRALPVAKVDADKAAMAWSEKATQTWATLGSTSCNKRLEGPSLLFDLGTHSIGVFPE